MNPARKRKVRLVVALTAAILLSGALVLTTVSASVQQLKPSDLLAQGKAGRTYKVNGKVVNGPIPPAGGNTIPIRGRDLHGTPSIPVVYSGSVPDPFRDGREIGVRVRKRGAEWA